MGVHNNHNHTEMIMKLTALEPEDLELLYTIENNRSQWCVSSASVPYSRYALRDYIANQNYDIYADKQVRFVVRVGEEGGKPSDMKAIGLVDLFDFSPEHLRAEVGIAIIAAETGKGYGEEAMRQLTEYAAEVLHMHSVYAVVPVDNKPSIAMLRACGFSEEYVLKGWLRSSEGWKDALFMQKML